MAHILAMFWLRISSSLTTLSRIFCEFSSRTRTFHYAQKALGQRGFVSGAGRARGDGRLTSPLVILLMVPMTTARRLLLALPLRSGRTGVARTHCHVALESPTRPSWPRCTGPRVATASAGIASLAAERGRCGNRERHWFPRGFEVLSRSEGGEVNRRPGEQVVETRQARDAMWCGMDSNGIAWLAGRFQLSRRISTLT